MNERDRPVRWFGCVAFAAAALVLVVIVASALMRHERSGLACDDWPTCYGRIAALSESSPRSASMRVVRIVHRVAASSVTLLVVALVVIAWKRKPVHRPTRTLATVAAVVVVGLAVLGVGTPDPRLPAVPMANLLGGYLLLALLSAAYVASRNVSGPAATATPGRPDALRTLALTVLVVAFVQAALGGLIGAQFALPACTAGPECTASGIDAWMPTQSLAVFQPWPVVDGGIVLPRDAQGLHASHRVVGMVLFAGILVLAVSLPRSERRIAATLLGLVLIAPILGGAAVHAMPSLLLTVLHNLVAAALIAALAATSMRA